MNDDAAVLAIHRSSICLIRGTSILSTLHNDDNLPFSSTYTYTGIATFFGRAFDEQRHKLICSLFDVEVCCRGWCSTCLFDKSSNVEITVIMSVPRTRDASIRGVQRCKEVENHAWEFTFLGDSRPITCNHDWHLLLVAVELYFLYELRLCSTLLSG